MSRKPSRCEVHDTVGEQRCKSTATVTAAPSETYRSLRAAIPVLVPALPLHHPHGLLDR
jgi:hypothetical protein